MTAPVESTDRQHSIAYGQLYMSGESKIPQGEGPGPQLLGLEDANQSGRRVGLSDGLVVVVAPVQFHWDATFRLELWDGEPALDADVADQVVDFDLDAPGGAVYFWELPHPEPSGEWQVPPARYRVRFSGYSYDAGIAHGGEEGGPDSYALRLWPRDHDSEPALRRAWFSWADAQ